MSKRTLILGASPNPERYGYKATVMLSEKGHPVFPVGIRNGKIENHEILLNNPQIENIDTITLYIGSKRQPDYYKYILKEIAPQRIIFNPGTENNELIDLAQKEGIKTEIACTLVMLSLEDY